MEYVASYLKKVRSHSSLGPSCMHVAGLSMGSMALVNTNKAFDALLNYENCSFRCMPKHLRLTIHSLETSSLICIVTYSLYGKLHVHNVFVPCVMRSAVGYIPLWIIVSYKEWIIHLNYYTSINADDLNYLSFSFNQF
ncbi:hypothetical protein VPH35_126067 [Triticum aestivum]